MAKDPTVPNPPDGLRRQAENKIRASAANGAIDLTILTPEAVRKLIHELRVHQIELETQNEELRRAQEELEALRERYFDLYNLAPVGYFSLSPKGLILEANLTGARMLGMTRSALDMQPLSRFIARQDQDPFYSHQRRLFESGATQPYRLRMMRQDGTSFWARIEASVVEDGAGGGPECLVVVSDIDAQRQADEERLALELRLREVQKQQSLATMAGAIAHHFNNQLAGVVGNLELAREGLPSDSEVVGFVREAEKSAWQATELSGAMLKYIGQGARRMAPLDLAEIVQEMLPVVRATLPENVRLVLDLPEAGYSVTMDPADARLVVMNLVTNAWEALGPDAGEVRVAVYTASDEDFLRRGSLVGADPGPGPWVCLEISDSGAGMDTQTMERMFDPFFSTKFTGRGLGLAVCLGGVRASGGAFLVESAPKHGTVARVIFPAGKPLGPRRMDDPHQRVYGRQIPGMAPAPRQSSQTGAGPSGKAVLLVDDEAQIRKVMTAMLSRLGFKEIFAARDGKQAVEIFGAHADRIGCAIVDIGMPGMDGWQTLQALRAIRPQLRVVLSSGYDITQTQRTDVAEQPDGWLQKPYKNDQLKALLAALLPA
jgi:PAS domain S-box-containing protein